jgi:hypothetical protein
MKKKIVKTLVAIGLVTILAILMIPFTRSAAHKDTKQSTKIKGVVAEKPVRQPFKMPTLEEMMATFGAGGRGGAPDGRGGAPGGSGGAAGGPPGMGSDEGSTPAIYVDNGKYNAAKSKPDVVTAGEVKEAYASGVKIGAKEGHIGGVYVKGIGSNYILSDAIHSVINNCASFLQESPFLLAF